jgi:hypothetical protein
MKLNTEIISSHFRKRGMLNKNNIGNLESLYIVKSINSTLNSAKTYTIALSSSTRMRLAYSKCRVNIYRTTSENTRYFGIKIDEFRPSSSRMPFGSSVSCCTKNTTIIQLKFLHLLVVKKIHVCRLEKNVKSNTTYNVQQPL